MRGVGAVEDVDGDCSPQDGTVVGDDDDDDFPLREGSSLGGIAPPEGKRPPAQVPPRDGGAPSRKSSPYFFLGQNYLYTIRWAPEVGLGEHNPPGTLGLPGAHRWVVPTWWAPLVVICSNNSYIFHKKSP